MKLYPGWYCEVCGRKKGKEGLNLIDHSKCSAVLKKKHAHERRPTLYKIEYDESTINYFVDLNYNNTGHPDEWTNTW